MSDKTMDYTRSNYVIPKSKQILTYMCDDEIFSLRLINKIGITTISSEYKFQNLTIPIF